MIENRQKTPSGPQGVLLGVPKDPQTTQMAIQDAKMWLPKLTNIKLWCQKGGKPESRRVKDWGPAAEGEALKIKVFTRLVLDFVKNDENCFPIHMHAF